MDAQESPRLVSIPEAAKLLGISEAYAYKLVQRGQLQAVKLGRRRLVPVGALDALVAELTAVA